MENPGQVESTKHEIILEARRLESACQRASLAHSSAARFWSNFHIVIGVPTSLLAAAAAAVVLTNAQYAIAVAAALAVLVSALTAIATFLNPKDKANTHELAAARFDALRTETRILHNIEVALTRDSELAKRLKKLAAKRSELIQSSPAAPQWSRTRAKKREQEEASEKPFHQAEVLAFRDVAEVYRYIARRLDAASESVDDITWGSRKEYRSSEEQQAYAEYVKSLRNACAIRGVRYREVSSLTDEHYFRRSIDLVKEGHYSYHLGYYDTSAVKIPLISYIIIDKNEAIFGFYRVPILSMEGEVYLRITDEATLPLFKDYFETLWAGSTKIKEGNTIDWNTIKSLATKLAIPDSYLIAERVDSSSATPSARADEPTQS